MHTNLGTLFDIVIGLVVTRPDAAGDGDAATPDENLPLASLHMAKQRCRTASGGVVLYNAWSCIDSATLQASREPRQSSISCPPWQGPKTTQACNVE